MKFKKIISGILSLTLILGVCSISAFAAENTSGCYVVTEETPEEILEYAKEEFPEFLSHHLSSIYNNNQLKEKRCEQYKNLLEKHVWGI